MINEATILLAGEITCPKELIAEKEKYGEEKLNYYDCFNLLQPMTDKADLSIASLSESYDYPDEFIEAVKENGFDMMTVGRGNKEDSGAAINEALERHKIAFPEGETVGTAIIDVNGIRIGIIDCSFNLAYRDMGKLSDILKAAHDMDVEEVDLKICYVHWRYEIDYMQVVDERQRAVAISLANMGIDYVVGAGTSYLMRYETVRGNWNRRMPVAYSLGNLFSCSNPINPRHYNMSSSAVICLKIRKDNKGKIKISDSYQPCFVWTTFINKRRRVQFLNDHQYKGPNTNEQALWRKQYVSSRIGDGIAICREFDENKDIDDAETGNVPDWIVDEFTRERIREAGDLQKLILDSYRLTDEFRDIYGKMLYSSKKYSPIIESAEHYLQWKYPDLLEREDARDIIVDMIYCRTVFDYTFSEYFGFHFPGKSILERTDYVSDMFRLNYFRRMNNDVKEKRLLDNKWTCYERMPDLYKREMLDISDRSECDRFIEYASKYRRFIIKPTNGSLGKGIRIIDIEEHDDLEVLFNDIFTKAGPFVCEELIVNKKYLSDVHPQSVNTVRVFTYNDDGDVKVVCAYLRAGRGETIVDNGGAGGLTAAINMKTGVVENDAAIENGDLFEVHPDTGIRFKGFRIEEWDSLVEVVKEAANRFPTVPFIAWDMAHGEKGWQVVEGNSQGQMWVYQSSSDTGMRREMEDLIGWSNSKMDN